MTFQQLHYLSEVARLGSINKAAQTLFVSQSAISNSILDLESEFHLKIFVRSAIGVSLTPEGEEFLTHARSLITQAEYLKERFNHTTPRDGKQLIVASMHLYFCTQTLVQLTHSFADSDFQVTLKEYPPEVVLEDVLSNHSEFGVLLLTDVMKRYMESTAKDRIQFHELCKLRPRICVRQEHPLTKLPQISHEDLEPYPYLTMHQGEIPPFDHAEEARLSFGGHPTQVIYASDRGSIDDILASTNAYHLSCGMDSPRNAGELCLIPLVNSKKKIRLGWISLKNKAISPEGKEFIALLTEMVKEWMRTSDLEQKS